MKVLTRSSLSWPSDKSTIEQEIEKKSRDKMADWKVMWAVVVLSLAVVGVEMNETGLQNGARVVDTSGSGKSDAAPSSDVTASTADPDCCTHRTAHHKGSRPAS